MEIVFSHLCMEIEFMTGAQLLMGILLLGAPPLLSGLANGNTALIHHVQEYQLLPQKQCQFIQAMQLEAAVSINI